MQQEASPPAPLRCMGEGPADTASVTLGSKKASRDAGHHYPILRDICALTHCSPAVEATNRLSQVDRQQVRPARPTDLPRPDHHSPGTCQSISYSIMGSSPAAPPRPPPQPPRLSASMPSTTAIATPTVPVVLIMVVPGRWGACQCVNLVADAGVLVAPQVSDHLSARSRQSTS